jgi:hypothetical protein
MLPLTYINGRPVPAVPHAAPSEQRRY